MERQKNKVMSSRQALMVMTPFFFCLRWFYFILSYSISFPPLLFSPSFLPSSGRVRSLRTLDNIWSTVAIGLYFTHYVSCLMQLLTICRPGYGSFTLWSPPPSPHTRYIEYMPGVLLSRIRSQNPIALLSSSFSNFDRIIERSEAPHYGGTFAPVLLSFPHPLSTFPSPPQRVRVYFIFLPQVRGLPAFITLVFRFRVLMFFISCEYTRLDL